MNMIRIDKQNPFISVPHAIIRTTQLTAEEKMLYLVLYDLTNNSIELQSFPTKAYLMERIGVKSNKTLIKYLKNLEELQLLKVIRKKTSGGMNASNVYIVQSTEILLDNSEMMNEFVRQMKQITQSFEIRFTDEQWKSMITTTLSYHPDNVISALLVKVLEPDIKESQIPEKAVAKSFELENHLNIPTEIITLFKTVFSSPTNTDLMTIKRLCTTYPIGVVQFALESVINKAERTNWGYITATIQRLAKNNSTYESCQQSKEAYFNEQNKRNQKIKAEQRQKQKLIMRLIELECFGQVNNPIGYAQKVLNDEKYKKIDIYELFDTLTGRHHVNAASYDQQIFEILFPV